MQKSSCHDNLWLRCSTYISPGSTNNLNTDMDHFGAGLAVMTLGELTVGFEWY